MTSNLINKIQKFTHVKFKLKQCVITSGKASLSANSHIPQALAAMQGLFRFTGVKSNHWQQGAKTSRHPEQDPIGFHSLLLNLLFSTAKRWSFHIANVN
ncbi:hypothetical protein [Thalassotalea euphylliae]|nr:hypothetical protein [Thalassotalea euphylliae]